RAGRELREEIRTALRAGRGELAAEAIVALRAVDHVLEFEDAAQLALARRTARLQMRERGVDGLTLERAGATVRHQIAAHTLAAFRIDGQRQAVLGLEREADGGQVLHV